MRPTEKARRDLFVLSVCDGCAYQVTAYPPVKIDDRTTDGGFMVIHYLTSDCLDRHSLRARFRRAWKAWRGCPDTEFCFEDHGDLERVIAALHVASRVAFPEAYPEMSGE